MKKTFRNKKQSSKQVALKYGFRSGLEELVAEDLESKGIAYTFEDIKIPWVKPARNSKYTPDFLLPNGIIIETKGRFVTEDRQKHLQIQKQLPHADIRFVFSNSRQKISKRSTTTYAAWCERNGFLYADKFIPDEWLQEPFIKERDPYAYFPKAKGD